MFLWLSIRISAGSHGGSVINTVVSRRTPEYSGVKRMLQLKRNEFIDSLLAQCSGSTRWKRNFWYLWGDSKPWLESSCGKSQLFGHDLEKQHRKKKKKQAVRWGELLPGVKNYKKVPVTSSIILTGKMFGSSQGSASNQTHDQWSLWNSVKTVAAPYMCDNLIT